MHYWRWALGLVPCVAALLFLTAAAFAPKPTNATMQLTFPAMDAAEVYVDVPAKALTFKPVPARGFVESERLIAEIKAAVK